MNFGLWPHDYLEFTQEQWAFDMGIINGTIGKEDLKQWGERAWNNYIKKRGKK